MSRIAAFSPRSTDTDRVVVDRLVVREATEADLDAVAELQASRNGGSLAVGRARLGRELRRRKRARLFVADADALVIGYGRLKKLPSVGSSSRDAPAGWYLLGVVVHPDWRRRGVGTHLTRARLDFIAERAREAFYVSSLENRASIALHAPFGFTELTREVVMPRVRFADGGGALYRVDL